MLNFNFKSGIFFMSMGRIGQRNALSAVWRAMRSADFIFTIKTCIKITLLWHSETPYNMSKWLRKENRRRKTLSGLDFESQIFLEKCNETCLWLSYFQHFPTSNVYLSKAWFRTHTHTHTHTHTYAVMLFNIPFPGLGEDIIRDMP